MKEEFEKKFGKFDAWRDVGNPKLEEHFSPEDIWTWIEQQIKQACDETGFETSEYYQAKIKQACDQQKEICWLYYANNWREIEDGIMFTFKGCPYPEGVK